jgi:cell division septal protein FtsQ
LSWVRDATVRRIWPNHLSVQITEREPAAFIAVPFGAMSRYALIDAAGVILEPPAKAQFHLPVLQGVAVAESQTLRGQRVRRMQKMMRELGTLGNGISEIDVADLDNLKVRLTMKDQSFLLILGDSDFAPRMQNFFNHYAEIHTRIPWASTLDLRLEDRITAVGEAQHGA